MIRNLKFLGVALATVFALSAVVASAASAAQAYWTSDGPFTLTGKETGTQANRLTLFGTFIECPGSTFTGHQFNTTPHQLIPHEEGNAQSTVTIKPTYVNCVMSALKLKASVSMEGCDYVLHLTETGGTDSYAVKDTIANCNEKHVKVSIPATGCVFTITERQGAYPGDSYSGLSAVDTTNGVIDLTGAIEGIEAHAGAGCPEAGGRTENAKWHQDMTVAGDNGAGEQTEIGISELGEPTNHV